MEKTETEITVDGNVYMIISKDGKPVKLVLEGKTVPEEYCTERLLELIDSVRAY